MSGNDGNARSLSPIPDLLKKAKTSAQRSSYSLTKTARVTPGQDSSRPTGQKSSKAIGAVEEAGRDSAEQEVILYEKGRKRSAAKLPGRDNVNKVQASATNNNATTNTNTAESSQVALSPASAQVTNSTTPQSNLPRFTILIPNIVLSPEDTAKEPERDRVNTFKGKGRITVKEIGIFNKYYNETIAVRSVVDGQTTWVKVGWLWETQGKHRVRLVEEVAKNHYMLLWAPTFGRN